VKYSDIVDYTGLPTGAVHEVSVKFANIETCSIVVPQLKNIFSDMDVQEWRELILGISMYFAFTDFMEVVILAIFLFVLSFGIINTMLTAMLERTLELGILGAIGMCKGKRFNMIMLETVFMTLPGSIIGMILGVVSVMLLQKSVIIGVKNFTSSNEYYIRLFDSRGNRGTK